MIAPTQAPAIGTETPSSLQPSQNPTDLSFSTTVEPPLPVPSPLSGVYAVIFDNFYLNLFTLGPNLKVNEANIDELRRITSDHILSNVRAWAHEPDLVVAVRTEFVTVAELSPWKNETFVSSQAVSGSVQFHVSYGRPKAEIVNKVVRGSFQNTALLQYLSELKHSPSKVLQSTQSVYVGLPSDILGSTTTIDNVKNDAGNTKESVSGSSELEEDWIQWGNWSDTDFVVFIVVGVCATVSFLLYTLCRAFGFGDARKDVGDKPGIVKHTNSAETQDSPSKNIEIDYPDNDANLANGDSMTAVIEEGKTSFLLGKKNMNVEAESSECDISDVTSIYSYIDSRSMLNDLEDHGYSVNDSYNPKILGDEESGQWSVADNVTTTESIPPFNKAYVAITAASLAAKAAEEEKEESQSKLSHSVASNSLQGHQNGPMIFSDNSEDLGEMASSVVEELDLQTDRDASNSNDKSIPTPSHVAAVIATFEAVVKNSQNSPEELETKEAKSNDDTNNDAASFPEVNDTSILIFAPDSPLSAHATPPKELEESNPMSEAASLEAKQLIYSSQINSVAVESNSSEQCNFKASTEHNTEKSVAQELSETSREKQETKSVPTSISVQNSIKSDDTKKSKRSLKFSSSFLTVSKSIDDSDKHDLPCTISINDENVFKVSKEDKQPKASYILRAKSWGSRTYISSESQLQDIENTVNRKSTNENATKGSSKGTAKVFPFRGFGVSKASKKALTFQTNANDIVAVRSSTSSISEKSGLETDSDIQSLCSNDNHSLFSFGGNHSKGGNNPLFMNGTSPYLQGTGLLGRDDDDSEDE